MGGLTLPCLSPSVAVGRAENPLNVGECRAPEARASISPCFVRTAVLRAGVFTGYVTSRLVNNRGDTAGYICHQEFRLQNTDLVSVAVSLGPNKQDPQLPFPAFT